MRFHTKHPVRVDDTTHLTLRFLTDQLSPRKGQILSRGFRESGWSPPSLFALLITQSRADLLALPGVGVGTVNDVEEILAEMGLRLRREQIND